MAHERLTEPRVTMKWLLAKPRSLFNLPVFLDLNGRTKRFFTKIMSLARNISLFLDFDRYEKRRKSREM